MNFLSFGRTSLLPHNLSRRSKKHYYENKYKSLNDMDVLTVVKRGIKPRAGIYYQMSIFCFSTKCVALRRKSKDYLVQNQDNVSVRVGRLQS